jgi:hypothetical protein
LVNSGLPEGSPILALCRGRLAVFDLVLYPIPFRLCNDPLLKKGIIKIVEPQLLCHFSSTLFVTRLAFVSHTRPPPVLVILFGFVQIILDTGLT